MSRRASVIADGIPWKDADGLSEWPEGEAISLAADLEYRQGYREVEVIPVRDLPDIES